jgi:CBS domain-containing protein
MFTKIPEDGLPTTLYTVPPDARVGEVAGLMAVKGVGAVVVVENQRPIGILTDRDIVVRVTAQMLDAEQVRVREAMSSPLVTVSKQEDTGVAVALMRRCGIRRLPIVDARGRLFSIVTLDDLLLLHLADQEDMAGIIRRQLHPSGKTEEPAGPAKDRFADLAPPAFPDRPSAEGTVAHIVRPLLVVAMERKEPPKGLAAVRTWFRHRLRWMAIMLALMLLAAAFAVLIVYWGNAFRAYNPQYYEPKDLSREQQLEQTERDRK